jgi:HK97 family phage prohead protease
MQDKVFTLEKTFTIDSYDNVENLEKGFYGSVSGILSRGNICDKDGDVIEAEAYHKVLQKAVAKKANIPFLFEHKMDQMIGGIELSKSASVQGDDLRITAYFDKSDLAQEKRELVKQGVYGALSIGCDALMKSSKYVNGKKIKHYNTITMIKEASLVKNPANQFALIDMVKSSQDEDIFAGINSKQQWKEVLARNLFKHASDDYLNFLWKSIHKMQDQGDLKELIKHTAHDIQSEIIEDIYGSAYSIIQKNIVATQTTTPAEATPAEATTNNFGLTEEMIKKLNATASIFNNK